MFSAFRDREVVHYIDNSGALFGLGKGASRDVPTARLVHIFHALAAALGMLVWFSYVPSKANVADLPSRLEFGLLREMGSQEVKKLKKVAARYRLVALSCEVGLQ